MFPFQCFCAWFFLCLKHSFYRYQHGFLPSLLKFKCYPLFEFFPKYKILQHNNLAFFFFIALITIWHNSFFAHLLSVSPIRMCILWEQTIYFCSLLKCVRHRVGNKYLWNKWMNSLAYLSVYKWLLTSMKALYYLQWIQCQTLHYPLNSGFCYLWWLKHKRICLS